MGFADFYLFLFTVIKSLSLGFVTFTEGFTLPLNDHAVLRRVLLKRTKDADGDILF